MQTTVGNVTKRKLIESDWGEGKIKGGKEREMEGENKTWETK